MFIAISFEWELQSHTLFFFPISAGVKISSLLGKKGNLEKLQSYWEVGFFLGASVLANDHTRVIQASEKLFKLKTPAW